MSINYLYHSVEVDAFNPNGYTEFSTLDFQMDFNNRSMVAGTVRFEGELRVLTTANSTPTLEGEQITMDCMIGAQALCQSCTTSTLTGGTIESLTNMPRYEKMKTCATKTCNDMNNGDMVCELRSPDDKIQERLIKLQTPSDIGGGADGNAGQAVHNGSGFAEYAQYSAGNFTANTNAYQNPDFSVKLPIVLNNVVGQNRLVNYDTTGTIKLSINLGRNSEVLYGRSMDANTSYVVVNPRICFVSVPAQPQQPVMLRSTLSIKSNLNSQQSNISARVPAICSGVSVSFNALNRENSNFFSNTALLKVPNLDVITFSMNDSTNKYLSYQLKETPEIIGEGLKALANGSGSNNVRYDLLGANKSFIAGLKFSENIDLSKNKLNIQIISGINNANPYVMYAYFHSLISL